MSSRNIPLSIPCLGQRELEYVIECIDQGWVSSSGSFVNKFEREIVNYAGVEFAIACVNGASALHISLILAGVGKGDTVIAPTIITQILAGCKKIKLGSLNPTRDLTYVEDTVKGFIKAGESKNGIGEVVNLGNKSEISICDLVYLIVRVMGVSVTIQEDVKRKRPIKSEVDRLMANNSKAKKLLKWFPEYSLEKGLKKTVAWFRENNMKYKSDVYNV